MAHDLQFDAATHTYRLNGAIVPSVTQIIAPLYAETLARIPRDVLERKRAIGIAVHVATELDDAGSLDEASVAPEIAGYLAGWRRFRTEQSPYWFLTETRLASGKRRYAGTLDRCGTLKDSATIAMIDIKTVDEVGAAVGVQLAAYAQLAIEERKLNIGRHLAVQLRPDGTYRIHPFEGRDHLACFNSLLAVHHWRAKHGDK